MTEVDLKEIVKESLKEWLDDKFTAFGKWSLGALGALALAALVYVSLLINGYHK